MDLDDIELTRIDGTPCRMGDYRGMTRLVVNVASQCGFTPQYDGLEALYRAHRDRGLVVMGFPCDQFGHQEPGDNDAIAQFCSLRQVSFPMFAKVEVNGPRAHPLYQALKAGAPGVLGSEAIKWNFTKFLVDGEGRVVRRYAPVTTPKSIEDDLAPYLR